MKAKHNKKRNTAFVYEALIREMSKSVLSGDNSQKNKILEILKKYFNETNILSKELNCYKALTESQGLDQYTAEKMIFRAREAYNKLDNIEIFKEQSSMINTINKEVSSEVFSNFVPNYRSYATISQIFNNKTSVKKKVILEQEVIKNIMTENGSKDDTLKPIDSLVVKTFTKNFNNKYKELLPEQKKLLGKYIFSFDQSEVDFRLFMSEELTRIRKEVQNSLTLKEVSSDQEMVENTNRVIEDIDQFNVSVINELDIKKILKLQKLVSEYSVDASDN
jgi:hypothetical protein